MDTHLRSFLIFTVVTGFAPVLTRNTRKTSVRYFLMGFKFVSGRIDSFPIFVSVVILVYVTIVVNILFLITASERFCWNITITSTIIFIGLVLVEFECIHTILIYFKLGCILAQILVQISGIPHFPVRIFPFLALFTHHPLCFVY
uniref:Uncharacterized protein n=1 Tax=Cacopsylla melanoneura TaxID=428564 RepID=A0A8D8U3A6_9HEMI